MAQLQTNLQGRRPLPSTSFRTPLVPLRMRRGFSLIEILVAMTILTIIVLIVAGIFQQTGLAWSLGLRRADAQSVTRAVVGAINRDLAMMVDPCNFVIGPGQSDLSIQDAALRQGKIDGATGELSGQLDFWMLRPADSSTRTLLDTAIPPRELVHVTYSGSNPVTRKEEVFSSSGSLSSSGDGGTTKYNLGNGSISFSKPMGSSFQGYTSLYTEPGVKITVKPATPATVNDYEISVGSCGPDGKWGSDDDIRPWVQGEDDK